MFAFYTLIALFYAYIFDESQTNSESCLFYFKCSMIFSMIGFVTNIIIAIVDDYKKRNNM